MKDTLRQICVVINVLIMVVINGLANALPINGLQTGEISDRFNVYFVPAGYVFSIWGLIYLGLIAFAVFQALPSQRENPRLRATGCVISLGCLANSAWIFLWHYEQFLLTVIAMLILLGTLILTYLRLGVCRTQVPRVEKYIAHLPFSIYLGWITVATVANISSVLDYMQWDRFGISQEIWMAIILAVVLGITTWMNFSRRDAGYTLVILWALAGIGIKHSAVVAVAAPTWAAFGLAALTFAAAWLWARRGRLRV